MAIKTANAQWSGSLKEGKGTMKSQSGVLNSNFSFSSRFEDGQGTNPEELLAAAHAGCYSMAFSAMLGEHGYTVEHIKTKDKVHLVQDEGGFKISKIDIITSARVPDIDEVYFRKYAEETKDNCPVSIALSGVEFTLNATLEA